MKYDDFFPSRFLKADDLNDREVTWSINSVTAEEINGEQKPVLRFEETRKGLVLNKTNWRMIEASYGRDTDRWAGKQLVVRSDKTQFQSKIVPCVRVRVPQETSDEPPF